MESAIREESHSEPAGEVADPAATLDLNPPQRRRRRRRKRSPGKRLLDSLLPFGILAGLLVLAGGLVGIVEHGAAASSKRDNRPAVRPVSSARPATTRAVAGSAEAPEQDLKLSETDLETSVPSETAKNFVAYQLQESIKAELGFQPPAEKEEAVSMDDVMDWGLIEESERLRSKPRSKAVAAR